jgi:hypothetical protein
MRKTLAIVFATAALFTAGMSSASAGEVTGSGGTTGMRAHANSECGFSGLEDGGDYPGQPAGPGAPPQNWGHAIKGAIAEGLVSSVHEAQALGFGPGTACNGHLNGRK